MAEPSKDDDGLDARLVRAVGHPLRVDILRVLNQRSASPSEMVELLRYPLGNIAYHTRVLEECGCVEVVRTERRRGVVEHYFRAVPRSFIGHQDWRKIPPSLRGSVTAASIQAFLDRLAASHRAGKIDDCDETTLHWVALAVDTEGRGEMNQILSEAMKRLEQVHERTIERAAERAEEGGDEGEEETTTMITGLAAFESAPDAPPPEEDDEEPPAEEPPAEEPPAEPDSPPA